MNVKEAHRIQAVIAHFAERVRKGEMTAEHVTRSLRPGSTLLTAWLAYLG